MSEAKLIVSFLRKLEYFDKPAIDAIADMIERGEHLEVEPFREEKTKPSESFEVEPFAGGQAWRVVAETLQSYLSSQLCMTMMARLTLYRACGENPRVVVKYALNKDKTVSFRVSIHRSNGEVQHFNRDGKP